MGVESFSGPVAVPEAAKDNPQAQQIEDIQETQQAQPQYKEEFLAMSKVDPEFAAVSDNYPLSDLC